MITLEDVAVGSTKDPWPIRVPNTARGVFATLKDSSCFLCSGLKTFATYTEIIKRNKSGRRQIQTLKLKASKNVLQSAALSGYLTKNLTLVIAKGSENLITCILFCV